MRKRSMIEDEFDKRTEQLLLLIAELRAKNERLLQAIDSRDRRCEILLRIIESMAQSGATTVNEAERE